jgi:transposase
VKQNSTNWFRENERRRVKREQRNKERKKTKQARKNYPTGIPDRTIGIDLGDEVSEYCVLDKSGEVIAEGTVGTDVASFQRVFGQIPVSRVAMEVGTHSPWAQRCVSGLGHEVIVANARKVELITESSEKDDRMDAQLLARLARIDVHLLSPIEHRGEQEYADLMVIRGRAALVRARTSIVNAARGMVKSTGERLPRCAAEKMRPAVAESLSAGVQERVKPLLTAAAGLSEQIVGCGLQIDILCKERYPQTTLLRQVGGVGALIALTFVLTLGDPRRFGKSRQVGPYLGMRPGRRNSGKSQPQLRISKEGDTYMRSLLVQAAHCILRSTAEDCDLKRFGLKLSKRGGKNARKRAKVAVARRLAVLLHHLWVNGEVYDPLFNEKGKRGKKAA